MAVGAIQNGDTGIMVHPYQAPTSTATPEKLTQQTAKVKVVEGNLIYDGWVSKAECFLLNGRYYFKLADFANAADTQLDVALETVEFEAKGEYAKAPYMSIHNGIEVVWNNDTILKQYISQRAICREMALIIPIKMVKCKCWLLMTLS